MWQLLAGLTATATAGLGGGSYLTKFIPEWNARGFAPLEKMWKPLWVWGSIFGVLLGLFAFFKSDQNPVVATIVAALGLFSLVVGFSDVTVRKVPSQVSSLMCLFGSILMFSFIFAGDKGFVDSALQNSSLIMRIPTDSLLPVIGMGIVAVLAGLLGFVKISSLLVAKVFLLMGQAGVFVIVYSLLAWCSTSMDSPLNEYWKGVTTVAILPLTALFIIWCFSWMVGDAIGGADIMYMYFISMILPFMLGPSLLLWAVLISMPIQLVAHLFAPIFNLGEMRTVRNGPIAQFFENRKAKKEDREPLKTKMRRGIAYLPILTVTVLVVTVYSLTV